MQPKLLTVLISAALASATAHSVVSDQMNENEATSTGNVLTRGLNTQGQRYSPIKQVNTATVSKIGQGGEDLPLHPQRPSQLDTSTTATLMSSPPFAHACALR